MSNAETNELGTISKAIMPSMTVTVGYMCPNTDMLIEDHKIHLFADMSPWFEPKEAGEWDVDEESGIDQGIEVTWKCPVCGWYHSMEWSELDD